jgi:hypothetical protein
MASLHEKCRALWTIFRPQVRFTEIWNTMDVDIDIDIESNA